MNYVGNDPVALATVTQSWRGVRWWLRARPQDRRLSPEQIVKALAQEGWPAGVVWRGSPSDPLAYLEVQVARGVARKQAWPRSVQWFGRQVAVASDALRTAGWQIENERTSAAREVVIRRLGTWNGPPPALDDAGLLPLEVGAE
jgi:hypothetical protein